MASSSKFSTVPKANDVFLSFGGDALNFTDHLYSALNRKKIQTIVRNDRGLERGDKISPGFLEAIEESKISVIIFSEGYASSTWCLDEVAIIIECIKKKGQMVIPVFYKVRPSDVRRLDFAWHEEFLKDNTERLMEWRNALREAALLGGMESTDTQPESKLVDEIVQEILKRLDNKHDVFLSFRGEDTRDNFTRHLHSALDRNEIQTFIDYRGLSSGDQISPTLSKAIRESKISVIIFSENYASSRWCLDELAEILECMKTNRQMVIPVFYKVSPSDVRRQTGSFGEAFAQHEQRFKDNMEKVQKWRIALTEAAKLSGWVSTVIRPDAKLVDEIVNDIRKNLSYHRANLVGMDSHFSQINFSTPFWEQVTELDIGCCNLTQIPEDFCLLSSVESLNLRENNFKSLPVNIKKLYRLKMLYMMDCEKLQSTPELPLGLQYLDASDCTELQSLPKPPSNLEESDKCELEILFARLFVGSWKKINFKFVNCLKLKQNSENWSKQRIGHMANAVRRLCHGKESIAVPSISLYIPGSQIPTWFSHQRSGSSITIELPLRHFNKRLMGFALLAVIKFENGNCKENIGIECNYHFQTNYKEYKWEYSCDGKRFFGSDHMILGYSPCRVHDGDIKAVIFEFRTFSSRLKRNISARDYKMKCCGVYPLYEEPNMTQSSTHQAHGG